MADAAPRRERRQRMSFRTPDEVIPHHGPAQSDGQNVHNQNNKSPQHNAEDHKNHQNKHEKHQEKLQQHQEKQQQNENKKVDQHNHKKAAQHERQHQKKEREKERVEVPEKQQHKKEEVVAPAEQSHKKEAAAAHIKKDHSQNQKKWPEQNQETQKKWPEQQVYQQNQSKDSLNDSGYASAYLSDPVNDYYNYGDQGYGYKPESPVAGGPAPPVFPARQQSPVQYQQPMMASPTMAYQQPQMVMMAPAAAATPPAAVFGDPEDKTPAEYAPTGAKANKWQLRYERFLLRQSLQNMDVQSCPKDMMVEMIKQCQRLDIEMRTSWIHYTNSEAKGVRDPSKHDEAFLRRFFSGLQDGSMEHYRRMKNPHRGETANEVFVGGIGVIAHDRITAYFREFGDLRYVDVKKDKGFGFVKFDDKVTLEKVLSKKEHVIEGKRVEVKPAENRSPKPRKTPDTRLGFLQPNRSSVGSYGGFEYGRDSTGSAGPDARTSAMSAPAAPAMGYPYMMQQPGVQYAWVPVQLPAYAAYGGGAQQQQLMQ